MLCFMPLAWLIWLIFQGKLGANPIEFVTRYSGNWSLRMLLITLCCTPVSRIISTPSVLRFRRAIGLWVFFYATCHLFTYLYLDQFFDIPEITRDIIKRPFITAGMVTFVLLFPLAITSNDWAVRLLRHRWKLLHRLVYLAVIGGLIHYWWLIRADYAQARVYLYILLVLFVYRLYYYVRRLRREW